MQRRPGRRGLGRSSIPCCLLFGCPRFFSAFRFLSYRLGVAGMHQAEIAFAKRKTKILSCELESCLVGRGLPKPHDTCRRPRTLLFEKGNSSRHNSWGFSLGVLVKPSSEKRGDGVIVG